jgi:hypothetical protein
MNIIHGLHDNNPFDFLIARDDILYQAVGRSNRRAEKMSAPRKEIAMHAHGHTTVWGTPIGIGRARAPQSWYQQLRHWWTAYKAARRQASIDALPRCWDAKREAVISPRAEAAPEMAAAHHAVSVATMLYGLSS